MNIEGEKNLEDVHGGKPETYYNSGKWQDGIAEAIIKLNIALKNDNISYAERQQRTEAYKKAMESVN